MLVSLTSELKIGFLDDITMAGRKDIVVKDIISIKDKTDKYGLVLNAAKCEVVYGDPLMTTCSRTSRGGNWKTLLY